MDSVHQAALYPGFKTKARRAYWKVERQRHQSWCFSGSLMLGCSSAMTTFLHQRPPLLQGGLVLQSELSPSLNDSFPLPSGLGMVTLWLSLVLGNFIIPCCFSITQPKHCKRLPHINMMKGLFYCALWEHHLFPARTFQFLAFPVFYIMHHSLP